MIKIDLAIPRKRSRLSTWQYALIWVAIFLAVVVLGGLGLVFQNKYLTSLETELTYLIEDSVRLVETRQGILNYGSLKEDYEFLSNELSGSAARLDKFLDVVRLIRSQLQPDMGLVGFVVTSDSAVVMCKSRSSLKVQRYIESLYQRDRISSFTHEPPSVTGTGEHKIILRIR